MLLLSLGFIGCKMQTNATKKLSDLDYTIVSGRELPDELYDILEEKKTESFKLTYEENDGLYLCVGCLLYTSIVYLCVENFRLVSGCLSCRDLRATLRSPGTP